VFVSAKGPVKVEQLRLNTGILKTAYEKMISSTQYPPHIDCRFSSDWRFELEPLQPRLLAECDQYFWFGLDVGLITASDLHLFQGFHLAKAIANGNVPAHTPLGKTYAAVMDKLAVDKVLREAFRFEYMALGEEINNSRNSSGEFGGKAALLGYTRYLIKEIGRVEMQRIPDAVTGNPMVFTETVVRMNASIDGEMTSRHLTQLKDWTSWQGFVGGYAALKART
jgi:hypothetical protein